MILKISWNFKFKQPEKSKRYVFLDFISGRFIKIIPLKKIKYHLEDGRLVEVIFNEIDPTTTEVVEIFEPEKQNSREMQRDWW